MIDTPEPWVNQAINRTLQFARIITERNPETGEYSFLSGAWQYDVLWPTPTSMTSHMLLDPLGYHAVVARHLEIFRVNQGSIKPPGKAYPLHPGYLSSPKTLTSIDWLSDHGAILYQVARHALLTDDQDFINKWTEPVAKACAFIKDARAITDHKGVPGVIPAAVATDNEASIQAVWNVGWCYRGLTEAVRLLKQIKDPRAAEFDKESNDYRDAFVEAYRRQSEQMPRWTDAQGQEHLLPPTSLSDSMDLKQIIHAFYLDTGPLFLVWSGLLDASDPIMSASAAYFRTGPNVELFDPRANYNQRPVLTHEISSCEPCYSWNVYHSWQLGDRCRYLEGMYSLLSGALSPQTYISCETREGIYGNVFASTMLADLVRLAVVDDRLADDELHLLRLVPKAWLRNDYLTRFEKIATAFGPVTVQFKLVDEGKGLQVSYEPARRRKPARVLLHVPPVEGLTRVLINNQPRAARPGDTLTINE